MRIGEPDFDDIRNVALHMRDSDLREFRATSFLDSREDIADWLVARYGEHEICIMASDETGPVAIGAMIESRPNVVSLLFFATERFPVIATPLTRFIRQRLFKGAKKAGCHRIECVSIDGHTAAHRWIEALGLSHQFAMPGYGKGGETFHQFAWIGDVRQVGSEA